MSILLRDTRTGITTSTDLFGDALGLYLRENPDIVRVGLGTTANSNYYVLLNTNDVEFTQPNTSNKLIFNPYTGSLSGITTLVGNVTGNVNGNAGSASSIAIGLDNSNATRYLTFSKVTSGIGTISVDTDIFCNPSTGTLNTLKFVKTGATATNFLKANGDDSVLLSSEVTNALGYVPANSASVTGQYPIGNSIILDDFSSSFNGSTTDFSLASASVPFVPAASSANLIVSVGGIIQKPGTDFIIVQSGGFNTSTIRFTTAPASGLGCFVVALGGQGALLSDVSWSAKGDMVVASGDNVAAILGVGANNSILIADTSASVGVKWGNSISNLTITNITGTAGTITTFDSTKGTITNLGGTNLNYTGIGTIANILNTNINSSGIITASTFNSTVATGTAPLTVASSTLVSNLNSQYLNGNASTYYLAASGGTATNLILSGTLTAGGGNGSSGQVLQSTGSGLQWGSSSSFASGTTLLFYQSSAPTGWTKSTSHDNKALRVVSGTGGGSGGSSSFTSVFASRGVPLPEHNHSASASDHGGHTHDGTSGSQNANHTHSFTTNDNGGHNHDFSTNSAGSHSHSMNQYSSGSEAGGYGLYPTYAPYGGAFGDRPKVNGSASDSTNSAGDHSHSGSTTSVGSHSHGGSTAGMSNDHQHAFTTNNGGSHGHSISVNNSGTSGASMDFSVQYIDVIICSKD
jgi:hypothetical protein